MAGRKPYDPRVKMPNFGMQYAAPQTDAPDIQSKAAEPFNDSGPSDTGFNNLTPAPESQLRPPQYGDRYGDPVEIKDPRSGKPFGFALAHGEDGASIWWGVLAATVSVITAKRENGKITEITQAPIITTNIYPASNLDTDTRLQTHLGWYGKVFLYWEANDAGEISNVEVKGPDVPDGVNISELKTDLTRETAEGKYFVKIGTVDADSPVDQQISGDVPWFVTIVKGDDQSSSDDSGGSEGEGSEKSSNAIVHMPWHPFGFGALATIESNEVLLEFILRGIHMKKRRIRMKIDHRFIFVCEANSLTVTAQGEKPYPIGATVRGPHILLEHLPLLNPGKINLRLTGVRKGFAAWNMPPRTAEQKAQADASNLAQYDRIPGQL